MSTDLIKTMIKTELQIASLRIRLGQPTNSVRRRVYEPLLENYEKKFYNNVNYRDMHSAFGPSEDEVFDLWLADQFENIIGEVRIIETLLD